MERDAALKGCRRRQHRVVSDKHREEYPRSANGAAAKAT
jgi:hypothetical protein